MVKIYLRLCRQGEEWRKIRSMLNANLMKPKHAHKYFSQLSSISEHLPDKIKGKRDDGDATVPNILNVLYAWSIDCKLRLVAQINIVIMVFDYFLLPWAM